MNIQELKETWLRRIKTLNEEIGKEEPGTEKMIRLIAKRSVYQYELGTLDQLEATHQSEIHDLERKAWECSVEMMEQSDLAYSKEVGSASILTAYKRNGEGHAWKNASRKLRKAFGFPKSETPEKFGTITTKSEIKEAIKGLDEMIETPERFKK